MIIISNYFYDVNNFEMLRQIFESGDENMILTDENIFIFCRAYNWLKKLEELESLIIKERWTFIEPRADAKNQKNPILENYIIHTFIRLHHVCKEYGEKEKLHIFTNGQKLCFNTGLFTPQYEKTFALLKHEEKPEDDKKWSLEGFVKESDYRLADFDYLPTKVGFFESISDLIYDTKYDLRINSSHILADDENIKRIPEEIRDAKNLQILFDGAVEQVKKKIDANYKIAVPQYFGEKVQLLLPLSLIDPIAGTVDLVLVVERKSNSYAGKTCLTLDMAYNNARLIARPETPWLARS